MVTLSFHHLFRILAGESKEFTVKMSVGVVTAMAGFFMYSHCKLAAAAAKRAEESSKGASPPHRGGQDAGELAGMPPSQNPEDAALAGSCIIFAATGETRTFAEALPQALRSHHMQSRAYVRTPAVVLVSQRLKRTARAGSKRASDLLASTHFAHRCLGECAGMQNGVDDPEQQPLWNGQRK